MAIISEVLSMAKFKEFRVVACEDQLSRPFNNIGIHDYESLAEIPVLFGDGDFVLTTLFVCKNSVKDAERYINALLNAGVSAIAVKEVFYTELPDSCIDLAIKKKIPLMFYPKHILAEDIIVLIKNLLNEEFSYAEIENKLTRLISGDLSRQEEIFFRKKINKENYPNIGVAYLKQKYKDEHVLITDGNNIRNAVNSFSEKQNIFINTYESGIMIFIGFSDSPIKSNKTLDILYNSLNNKDEYTLGYELMDADKDNLLTTINNAIIAARASYYEGQQKMAYEEVGIYCMILPENENWGLINKSKKIVEDIKLYDEEYNSNLFECAKIYIDNEGDISKTAKMMHQHTNTVRYKINKLKNVVNNKNFYVALYLAIKVNKIENK